MFSFTASPRRAGAITAAAAVGVLLLSACSAGGSSTGGTAEGDGKSPIKVWAQQGLEAEVATLQKMVDTFTEESGIEVDLRFVPKDTYTQAILSTSAEDLPDVLQFDGPTLANFVYNDKVGALDDYVSAETLANQTPGIDAQNVIDGKHYGVGWQNSGVALWGNKTLLDAAGVVQPTSADEAWTFEDFIAVLDQLKATDPDGDGKVLDIGENNGLTGEYGIYAFAPAVWSAGAPILRDGAAAGALDSPEAVKALEQFASLKPYIDASEDGQAFADGRVALSWNGHWNWPTFSEGIGEENVQLGPLPDFGEGAKSGSGTIAWAVGGATKNGAAAGKFLDFLMQDDNVTTYLEQQGGVPATISVAETDPLYAEGGPLNFFAQELAAACPTEDQLAKDCVAVARPLTAGYPVVTEQFGKALSAIYNGEDAQSALTAAAEAIDQDFADNDNYQK